MSNGPCDSIREDSCAASGRIRGRRGDETRRVGGVADAPPGEAEARRFSAIYSDFDFLDMLHMPLFYNGAQYLTNGPLSKEPTFLIGCTLF